MGPGNRNLPYRHQRFKGKVALAFSPVGFGGILLLQ
jgi:hypothetical protein